MQIPAYLRGLNAGYHRIYYSTEDFHVLVRTIDEVKFLVAYRIALHKQRLSKLRLLIILSWVADGQVLHWLKTQKHQHFKILSAKYPRFI